MTLDDLLASGAATRISAEALAVFADIEADPDTTTAKLTRVGRGRLSEPERIVDATTELVVAGLIDFRAVTRDGRYRIILRPLATRRDL